MNNQLTEFAKATEAAACKIFTEYGDAVTALQTIALVAPPLRPVSVALGLGQWAAQNNCNWDPYQPGPGSQCSKKVDVGFGELWFFGTGFPDGSYQSWATEITSESFNNGNAVCQYIDNSGRPSSSFVSKPGVDITSGRWCLLTGAPPEPVDPPAPYVHETEDGCSLTVNFEAWGQNPDGTAAPIFMIEPSAGTRASGGVIGGCNFNPTIYYPGPGGGGGTGGGGGGTGGGDGGGGGGPVAVPYLPEPNPDGQPVWQDLLNAALAGAAGAAINQALEAALAKVYDGAIYRMEAPCDKDEDGNPLVWEKEIPPAPSTDALGYRLTAIHEQISQALAWKTPICRDKPELEGDWRTISFRSDSTSPYGRARLRKRLRYRSNSGLGLREVVDHWKDFFFESGPVVVCHSGSSWGTPQVWAATADEGKRVIRHAAGEAGIDPDQVGRWTISGSSSARYGVSDTMRVDKRKGFWWISARDGSDNRPIVERVSHPYGSGVDKSI